MSDWSEYFKERREAQKKYTCKVVVPSFEVDIWHYLETVNENLEDISDIDDLLREMYSEIEEDLKDAASVAARKTILDAAKKWFTEKRSN